MATLEWEPLHTPRLVAFALNGTEEHTCLLDPGTGHTRTLTPGRTVVCPYPHEGAYMAHVLNPNDQVIASAQVTIRDQVPALLRPGSQDYSVQADYTGTGAALIEVGYGDATAPERAWRTPGDTPALRWVRPGSYTATLTDVHARRSTRQPYRVTDPSAPDPEVIVAADPADPRRTTALLELAHTTPSRGPVEIDWGDGTPAELVDPPTPGTVLRHRYNPANSSDGTFLLLCSYATDPGQAIAKAIQIPFPAREAP